MSSNFSGCANVSAAYFLTSGQYCLKEPPWPRCKWHSFLSIQSVIKLLGSNSRLGSRWNGMQWWTLSLFLLPQAAQAGFCSKKCFSRVGHLEDRLVSTPTSLRECRIKLMPCLIVLIIKTMQKYYITSKNCFIFDLRTYLANFLISGPFSVAKTACSIFSTSAFLIFSAINLI